MSKITLTVACPEADRTDATHLAVALGWFEGYKPEEWFDTFTAQWQDASGNLSRVMSMPVQSSFEERAGLRGDLQRPPEDIGEYDPETGEYGAPYVVNLTGARRAQDKLVIWQPAPIDPETGEPPDNPVPQADGTKIVAVVGMKGTDALAAMGLERIVVEI